MEWFEAKDISRDIRQIVKKLKFEHVDCQKIICFRSYGSKSKARARIWSFPKIWQQALHLPPYYIIEVLSQRFDKLGKDDQHRVLIHELMHIPKNFSGSLVPHRSLHRRIDARNVEKLFRLLNFS